MNREQIDVTDTGIVLVGIEEQPGALSEAWVLFLQDVRRLAAEARRRRAATTPAANRINDPGAQTKRA